MYILFLAKPKGGGKHFGEGCWVTLLPRALGSRVSMQAGKAGKAGKKRPFLKSGLEKRENSIIFQKGGWKGWKKNFGRKFS